MKAPIPWGRILAEGTIIVVSILLAFLIQAWWEGSQARSDERVALRQLSIEFVATRQTLQDDKESHRRQRDGILGLLETIVRRGDPPGSYMVPDSLFLTGALGYRTFESAQGVLTSLISSGRIALISDTSLQIELASWLDAVEALHVDENTDGNLRLEVSSVVNQFIPKATLRYRRGLDGLTGASPFEGNHRALLNSLVFENLLISRLIKKNEILEGPDGYELLRARLDRILELIDSQLSGGEQRT